MKCLFDVLIQNGRYVEIKEYDNRMVKASLIEHDNAYTTSCSLQLPIYINSRLLIRTCVLTQSFNKCFSDVQEYKQKIIFRVERETSTSTFVTRRTRINE